MSKSKSKNFRFYAILILLLFLLTELISYGALLYLKKFKNLTYNPSRHYRLSYKQEAKIKKLLNNELDYLVHSATLGWTIKPNGSSELYTTNAQGIRSSKVFSKTPAPEIIRIATFGDSFIHGDEVENIATWQELINVRSRRLEALNFGVPGFGTDQALLRYINEGTQYNPHVVILGITLDNVLRNVNTFRPFYTRNTGIPLTKPRFIVENNKLKLLRNPFSRIEDYQSLFPHNKHIYSILGEHDELYNSGYRASPLDFLNTIKLYKVAANQLKRKMSNKHKLFIDYVLNSNTDAYLVTTKIISEFKRLAIKNGSIPIVLYTPSYADYRRYKKNKLKLHNSLIDYMRQEKITYLDLVEELAKVEVGNNPRELFTANQHFTEKAHRIIKDVILEFLNQKGLI